MNIPDWTLPEWPMEDRVYGPLDLACLNCGQPFGMLRGDGGWCNKGATIHCKLCLHASTVGEIAERAAVPQNEPL